MSDLTAAVPDVVRRWQAGWGLARGVRVAEQARGGLHVLIGKSGHYREVVVLDADGDGAGLSGLAVEVASSDGRDCLMVPTNRVLDVERVVRAAGLELPDPPEWLMWRDLREHPSRAVGAGYRCVAVVEGPLIEVEIRASSGDVAARGTMAVVGADAVAHNIETRSAHRRRGLAGAVMSALVHHAVGEGARTGLLLASRDGQRLYSALGWNRCATVLTARGVSVRP
ncbi:MAG: GNAT family N-acetyltransferase [Actinomycetota bacterium]|nr:GNAT family N-acetyltransferase [Actinomycetota bacterium]